MQPKSSKKDKDVKPILFVSATAPSPSSTAKATAVQSYSEDSKAKPNPGTVVFVCIKLIEVNTLKIQNRHELEGKNAKASEMGSRKRDFAFPIPKEQVKQSKYLKSNYLPDENIVEWPIPVNMNIPHAPFDALQKVIEAMVEKEKKESTTYPLEVSSNNSVQMFMAAITLGLEDLAVSIYEAFVKAKMNLKLLIGMMLITLEGNMAKLYLEFYKMFREYWLYKEKFSPDPSPIVAKLLGGKDDGTNVEFENDMFYVYFKNKLEFAFPPAVLKRPFEMLRKETFRQYFKPEQKYYVMNTRRKRNIEDNDGILESKYPHHYYLINQQTNDITVFAIRKSEYGDFYIFGEDETNEQIYGNNFIGHVKANTWGTVFEIFDDGIDEDSFQNLPKFICALRARIACISFETNFMGETPREMTFKYLDFAEKTNGELVPMKPKYDEANDCYTLNFFGKAKLASARNFILTFPHDQENVIFLHGKAGKDLFNLDFRHPLNFVQAFSISLVSIGKKFCVS